MTQPPSRQQPSPPLDRTGRGDRASPRLPSRRSGCGTAGATATTSRPWSSIERPSRSRSTCAAVADDGKAIDPSTRSKPATRSTIGDDRVARRPMARRRSAATPMLSAATVETWLPRRQQQRRPRHRRVDTVARYVEAGETRTSNSATASTIAGTMAACSAASRCGWPASVAAERRKGRRIAPTASSTSGVGLADDLVVA